VQVNHTKVTPHYFLELKDEITGELPQVHSQPQLTLNAHIPIQVQAADKDFVILEKPVGLIVHQSSIHPAPDTLANGIAALFPECRGIGEDPLRPGIIHRLDKEVSGLIIIARTTRMWQHLKQQFQEHKVHKEYLAVVHGIFSHKNCVIKLPLMRTQDKGYKIAARTDQRGKKAETHYEVLKEGRHRSLIRVIIRTGRTHQIRSHLQALGHPIIGDETYSSRNFKLHKIGRILLHATKLAFVDLKGEQRIYESTMPNSWEQWIKDLQSIA
jgi:23S rRNA pseudouridine1911/1915/1917 synthase